MATPLDDIEYQRVIDAWLETGKSITQGATSLGMNYNTFKSRLKTAKSMGMHTDPSVRAGMAAMGMTQVPPGGWIKSKPDPDTGLSYSYRFQTDQADASSLTDDIRAAFEGMEPAALVAAPLYHDADLITVYPLADIHFGLMSWGRETGEAWDTNSASDRVRQWIGRAVDASPASSLAVIIDCGDLTHADDQKNQTPTSKHALDVDTRHFRTLEVTIAALSYAVEYTLRKHAKVVVRILPGNHNPTAYLAVMFALAERYRNEERVEVQKVPGEFWVYQFGNCMLAAHHGHGAKPERMVFFLADEYATIWGQTKHRFLWTGHLHHLKSADIGGVQWEQLRAVSARDAYAVSHAYTARAQLQAITFHRHLGEIQRVKVAA